MKDKLEIIKKSVEDAANKLKEDAALSGSLGDGGAYQMKERLKYFVDGYNFATTGKTVMYNSVVSFHEKMNDPEYAEFLRLKEKFE